MEWLTEPLAFAFMQRALLASVAVGIVCALLSCFLVLKGWALMGDAIAHAVLPGVVLAWLATGYIKDHCRVKEDAVMGIVFSGMFAVGLVMFSRLDTDQHLTHLLFGNVLGISRPELVQTLVIAVLVTGLVLLKQRDLVLFCFDPAQARVSGLPVTLLHYGLLGLLALTIVAALQAVGVILVIAMLITPGITAFQLCRRFPAMLTVAVLVSVFACVSGTYLSFYIDAATGPVIVLIQAGMFVLAYMGGRVRGHKAG